MKPEGRGVEAQNVRSTRTSGSPHNPQRIDLRAGLVVWAQDVEVASTDSVEHVEYSLLRRPSACGLL
jgi:hypothetical protein